MKVEMAAKLKWSESGVLAAIQMDTATGCWLWTGPCDRDGYGKVGGRLAHRVVYGIYQGCVPPELDHLCRNRVCVRPGHLEPVTHHQNILRGESPASHHARQEKCSKGHDLHAVVGRRRCRECARDASRRYRARKRGEG